MVRIKRKSWLRPEAGCQRRFLGKARFQVRTHPARRVKLALVECRQLEGRCILANYRCCTGKGLKPEGLSSS